MINAKKCVLTTLLVLMSGSAIANSSVSGLSQQELNKLGQNEAKGNSAYKEFNVKDDQLKEINPEYDKTDLTSTYNSMQAPTAAGNAKKWQCLSYTDAQISGFYKSSVATEKQLAIDCDAIRAAEKTNDKMEGRYGDPLENELVRLFTERQNEQANNSKNGNVNIECSPLGGTSEYTTEERCLVQMLPVEKTCTRELKVVCYNKETGKLLDGNETCGGDKLPPKSISSLGNWSTSEKPKNVNWRSYYDYTANATSNENFQNTVQASFRFLDSSQVYKEKNPEVVFSFKVDTSIHPQPYIKVYQQSIRNEQGNVHNPRIFINGTEIANPVNRQGSYSDINGTYLLGANLFKDGVNSVRVTAYADKYYPYGKSEEIGVLMGIGFKNKCTEIVCTETWNESCVQGDVLSGDEIDDIIEDDSPITK